MSYSATLPSPVRSRTRSAPLATLLAYLAELVPLDPEAQAHRVELHHVGDGGRVSIALQEELTGEDRDADHPTVPAVSAPAAHFDSVDHLTLESGDNTPRVTIFQGGFSEGGEYERTQS